MAEFRVATQADCALIAEMERKYIECAWSARVVSQTIADGLSTLYLLEDEGRVIGYGGIKIVFDEAEIYNIAVDEEYRRRGFGKLIVNKLISAAQCGNAKKIFLEVNALNSAAVALYESCGFKKISERKNYYKSGVALVYSKQIN